MRRLIVLALLLVACGPNKARLAYEACLNHMNAKNFDAAVAACDLAASLEPNNAVYDQAKRSARYERGTERIRNAVEARMREAEAAQQSDAAYSAAMAAQALQDQARILRDEQDRIEKLRREREANR